MPAKFMRSLFLCMLAVAVSFGLPGGSASPQNAASPQESVWFVLSEADPGKLSLDPITTVMNGRLHRVPDDCNENDPEYKEFAAQYLQPGQTYTVTFRGTQAGRAIIQQGSPPWLNGVLVNYDGPILIRGKVMALATNAALSFRNAELSRFATPSEQTAVLEVAKIQFGKAGLPASLLQNVRAEEVLVQYLDRNMQPTFVGSFSVEQEGEGGAVHSLFLIATRKGRNVVPQFVWNRISKGEKDNQTLQFVDYADLLGDGQYEIVLRLNYSENYRYRLLRRTKDKSHWEQIFETQILGCGRLESAQ
jgi:hypothetical protein